MQLAKLSLPLALSVAGCCSYTWRPLQDAAIVDYPALGRVRLETRRGWFELEEATATPRGVEGLWKAPDGKRQPLGIRLDEIRGGAVYEEDPKHRRARLIGALVALGVAVNAFLVYVSVGGWHQRAKPAEW